MLGWEIHIINKNTEQRYGDWLAGLGATEWLDKLVEEGKGEKIYQVACSYYLIKAKDVIPKVIELQKASKNVLSIDSKPNRTNVRKSFLVDDPILLYRRP